MTGHIQSPKHITSNILGTWGLMSICFLSKIFTKSQAQYKYYSQVPVHVESINRPSELHRQNYRVVIIQVPVHIDIINRPLEANGVDLYGFWEFTEHSIMSNKFGG